MIRRKPQTYPRAISLYRPPTQPCVTTRFHPRWLWTLKRGATLTIWSATVVIIGLPGAAILSALCPTFAWAILGAISAAFLIFFVGTWLLIEIDRSEIVDASTDRACRITRGCVAFGLVTLITTSAFELLGTAQLPHRLLLAVSSIGGCSLTIAVCRMLYYLAAVMEQLSSAKLASRTRAVMWGLACSHLIQIPIRLAAIAIGKAESAPAIVWSSLLGHLSAAAMISVVVFLFMFLFLLEAMAKRFGEQAALAEASWARIEGAAGATSPPTPPVG